MVLDNTTINLLLHTTMADWEPSFINNMHPMAHILRNLLETFQVDFFCLDFKYYPCDAY